MQTHHDCRLLIVEDGGQFGTMESDRWTLLARSRRFASLATKRNSAVDYARRAMDAEGIAVWDDDDWYFPWALEACDEALQRNAWARPTIAWDQQENGEMHLSETFARGNPNDIAYHGSWAYTVKAFESVDGYPEHAFADNDVVLAEKLLKKYGPSADPISERWPDPYYVYCRARGGFRASEMSDEQLLAMQCETRDRQITDLASRWDAGFLRLPGTTIPMPRKW